MKYPQLNALVPTGEHFDESAINEGVYLSVGHVNSIEETLAGHITSMDAVNVKLDEANTSISTLNTTVSSLEEAATTSATVIKTQSEKIVELEATVAKLSGLPSGKGSVVAASAGTEVVEEKVNENGKPSFDSADHPANRFADSQKKYDSGLPAKK